MGNSFLVLPKPPDVNTCPVDCSIVGLKGTPPSREEMLHNEMQMLTQDGNVARFINRAF